MAGDVAWSMTRPVAANPWQFQLALLSAPLMRRTRVLLVRLPQREVCGFLGVIISIPDKSSLFSGGWATRNQAALRSPPQPGCQLALALWELDHGVLQRQVQQTCLCSQVSQVLSLLIPFNYFPGSLIEDVCVSTSVIAFCLSTLRCLLVSPVWHEESQLHSSTCSSTCLFWIQL